MPESMRNVFISHIHEDDAGLARLKDLTARQALFNFAGST